MITKSDLDFIKPYLKDASNFMGNASLIYIPENIPELKQIIRQFYIENTKFTISGARTGLTGSAVPLEGVVISSEKLDKIIEINILENYAILQPGVIIADFQTELNKIGYFYAPHPTEQNSFIGGNVATNASGARTFKYGATRNFIKKLQIILPDGDELNLKRGDCLSHNGKLNLITESGKNYSMQVKDINIPRIKHAAGYYIQEKMDAIDLFIGSEGTLGFVGEIEVEIVKEPEKILGGIVFFQSTDSFLNFVDDVRDKSIINNKIHSNINQGISARLIEFFDDKSLRLLKSKFPQIPENCAGAIWFEQEYAELYEDIILQKWSEIIYKYSEYPDETWFAMNEQEHRRLAEFRHELPLQVFELITKYDSLKIGTDTAVPDIHLKEYYYYMKNILNSSGLIYFMWGHIGNTHFHANMLSKNVNELEKAKLIYNEFIAKALQFGGTVSAEHGIGKLKKDYLLQMYGINTINLMKNIKKIIDPKMLMGSGNIFD